MKTNPWLIVGQGLAGTHAGLWCYQHKVPFVIIDNGQVSASQVSSGLINPITGRRLVKSWRIEELFRCSDYVYEYWSHKLKLNLYHKCSIFKFLPSPEPWDYREGDVDYHLYMGKLRAEVQLPEFKKTYAWVGEICNSRRLEVRRFLENCRQFFISIASLHQAHFEYTKLEITDNQVHYQGKIYQGVIFCEGVGVTKNPYFQLNLVPAKGERVLVEIKELNLDYIFKDHYYIIPHGRNRYWIGPTNEWEFLDSKPSAQKKQEITSFIEQNIGSKYRIIDHGAGIRPAAWDRRPMVGRHSVFKNLYVINGLGTKGISLAPWTVQKMFDFIYQNLPLPDDISLDRNKALK